MTGTTILLLEEEAEFASSLLRALKVLEPTWRVDWVYEAGQAVSKIIACHHHGALIDWNLGEQRTGLDVCRELRQAGSPAALVILSGREAVEDRIAAMKVGADDFITKSTDPREFCARVHVALARAAGRDRAAKPAVLSHGPLLVYLLNQQVFLDEKAVDLTKHQWLLLVRMMRCPGEPVPPAELCEFAGIQVDPAHQNLRTEMRRLRQRLGDGGALIRSTRGLGYSVDRAHQ